MMPLPELMTWSDRLVFLFFQKYGFPFCCCLLCFLIAIESVFAKPGDLDQELSYLHQEAKAFDMMVTAGKRPERIADVPASVLVMTREEIKTQGYESLADILANVPGLYTFGFAHLGDRFVGIRGLGTDSLVILVNGVNQVDDVQSSYVLPRIPVPVEAIDRIEIVRGPLSVMYGAGAFLGVINIITNEISSVRRNNLVSTSAGSDNTRKAAVRIAGKKKNWEYAINGSVYRTDGLDRALMEFVNDPADLLGLGIPLDARTEGRMEERNGYVNVSASNDHLFFNFSYADTRQEGSFMVPSLNEGTEGHFQTFLASAGYHGKPLTDMWFETKITYSHMRQENSYNFLNISNQDHQTGGSDAVEAEANFFYTPTRQMDFATGVYYRYIFNAFNQYHVPSLGVWDTEDQLASGEGIATSAVFAQARYVFLNDLKLIAGVRFEKMNAYRMTGDRNRDTPASTSVTGVYDQSDIETIPRLAAIYEINPGHVIKAIYTTAIRRPSFWYNTKVTLDGSAVDDLSPEHVTAYEINYSATLSPRFKTSVGIFRNEFDDMIGTYSNLDSTGTYTSQTMNHESFYTNGAEFTVTSQILPTLKVQLSAAYQYTRLKNRDDIIAPNTPEFLGYAKLSYQPVRDLTIGLSANYVAETQSDFEQVIKNADGTTTYGNRITEKAPDYLNIGLNIRAENIWKPGVFINVKISNLLDQDIRSPGPYSWAGRGVPGFGRRFLISTGIAF